MISASKDGSGSQVLVETSRAVPLVSVSVTFTQGSVLDPVGKEGLTRLTGRLMRRTGAGLSADQLDTRIDTLGSSLGVDVSHSAISFQGTCISRSLEAYVNVIQDVVGKASLSEHEFNKLKGESQAELLSMLDSDQSIARHWFRRELFAGHPYGRPAGGTLPSVPKIEHVDAQQHATRMIDRGRLLCAFAGDIDTEQAERFAAKIAAAAPVGATGTVEVGEPNFVSGRHLVVVDKPERTQTQILIGTRGSHPKDADHTALHVANTVFGGTFTSRLMHEVRSKRGWSYGASSNIPYDRQRQAFSILTFPKAEDAAPCIELELALIEQWCKEGVTQAELDWAKNYLIRSHAFSVDTASKRVAQKLDEALYDLPAGYHEHYLENIQAVTLEQANQAVANRISPKDLLIVVVCTEKLIAEQLKEKILDLKSYKVIPYDGETQA